MSFDFDPRFPLDFDMGLNLSQSYESDVIGTIASDSAIKGILSNGGKQRWQCRLPSQKPIARSLLAFEIEIEIVAQSRC